MKANVGDFADKITVLQHVFEKVLWHAIKLAILYENGYCTRVKLATVQFRVRLTLINVGRRDSTRVGWVREYFILQKSFIWCGILKSVQNPHDSLFS